MEPRPLDPKVRAEAAEWLRLYVTNQPRIASMIEALLAAEQHERLRADVNLAAEQYERERADAL